jgi:hypothetical protein
MTGPMRLYAVTVLTDYVVEACSPEAAADDYAAGDPIGSEVVAVDGYGWNLDADGGAA